MTALYYCMGGGLGHITRFTAFCNTTGLQPYLLTNCEAVKSQKISVNARHVFFPPRADQQNKMLLRQWVKEIITRTGADHLIIDSFPGGILGELCDLSDLSDMQCDYLIRILKLPAYLQRATGRLPRFTHSYILETLLPQQYQALDHANTIKLTLKDPETTVTPDIAQLISADTWLIIHSGNNDELLQLWLFAKETAEMQKLEPPMVMISPGKRPDFLPDTCLHLDIYPAYPLLTLAGRVFSAAGFNIIRQMQQSSALHHVMPFSRALDDQFFRAATHKKINKEL